MNTFHAVMVSIIRPYTAVLSLRHLSNIDIYQIRYRNDKTNNITTCNILLYIWLSNGVHYVTWHSYTQSSFCAHCLTHFMPLFSFDTLENIRKPKVFWCFQGVSKETSGMNGLTNRLFFFTLLNYFLFPSVHLVIMRLVMEQ